MRTAINLAYVVAQDTSVSWQGAPIKLEHLNGYSVSATTTWASGTLAGTLKLQMSNDAALDTNDAANPNATWADVAGSSTAISLTTGSTTTAYNVSQVYYKFARLVWVSTSGTGTTSANFFAKQSGSH